MKKLLKVLFIAAAIFALMAFSVRAEGERGEYIVTRIGDEYLISAYIDSSPTPIKRTDSFAEIVEIIDSLENPSRIIFSGVSVNENAVFKCGEHIFQGSLTFLGDAFMTVDGADITMSDFSLTSSSSALRVKSGSVTLTDSDIYSSNKSAVVLDYSAGAEFYMRSGSVKNNSASPTILLRCGSAYILGGSVESTEGVGIESSSTLVLANSPEISGAEYGIYTLAPITLSNSGAYFSGAVSIKHSGEFMQGTVSCVFYSASEKALENIKFYDKDGEEKSVRYFESHEMLDETSCGAVFLPYTVNFYSSGELIDSVEALTAETLLRPCAPDISGYRFLGWIRSDGDGYYDFASTLTESINLYAKYELIPPTFSISSLEFTYDGKEHSFGISSITHPLKPVGVISYMWYKNGAYVSDSGPTLTLKEVAESGEYYCKVTFSHGIDTVSVTTPSVSVNINKAIIAIPEIADKYYNGENQSADIYTTSFYKAAPVFGCIVGVYPVRLTLLDSNNYIFENGSDVAYSDFRILKADNYFTDSLTANDVYIGNSPDVKSASRFGEVEYLYSSSYDGVYTSEHSFSTPGVYFCIARVVGTDNYNELKSEPVSFSVREEIITGISISEMPKRCDYVAFEGFIADGLVLSVSYNSMRTELIGVDKITFSYQTADSFRFGDTAVIASYLGSSIAIPISVGKAVYDLSGISFSSRESVFNGESQSIGYYGEMPIGLDGIPLTAHVTGGGKNAGVYTVVMSFSTASKNYSVPSAREAFLTVLPYESEVFFVNTEFTYDGEEKCPEAYYLDVYGRKTVLRVEGARSLAGEYIAVASGDDSNYRLLTASTSYVINKADYDFSGVIWSAGDFVYDGVAKSVSVSGLPRGVVALGYSDNTATSAGRYRAKVSLMYDEKNYNPPSELFFDWEIKKAEYDTSVFSFMDKNHIYNGAERYPELKGVMPVGIDGIALEYHFVGGATHVFDGRTAVEIVFNTASKNYNAPKSQTAYVEILPLEISVVWNHFEFTYDTSEHAPSAYADECRVTVLGAMKNAGSYTATATPDSSDYTIRNANMEFIIHKAENFFTSPIRVEDGYLGREIAAYAECLGGEVYFLFYLSDGKTEIDYPSEAGKYYAVAVSDGDGNYKPIKSEPYGFSLIEIIPTSMTVNMINSDFTAKTPPSSRDFSVSVENNDGSTLEIGFDDITVTYQSGGGFSVGDTHFTVSYLGFSEVIPITVRKADYDMSRAEWSECEFIYDGEEKRIFLIGLPDGVSVREYIGAGAVLAGEYTATAVLDYDTVNYNKPYIPDCVFKIKKQTVEPPTLSPLVYNGDFQAPMLDASELYTVRLTAERNAGKYEVLLTLRDAENYEFQDSSATASIYYEITPRAVTLTLFDVHKYKMSAMPIPEYSVSGEVLSGDDLKLRFTYADGSVDCISENPNYIVTVIPAKIIMHSGLSEEGRFKLFLIIILSLTLILVAIVCILRRRAIFGFFSVMRCRLSPVAKAVSAEENTENNLENTQITEKPEKLEISISVDAERADSLISDSLAKDLVRREDMRIETEGRKKRIINVDTISDNFTAGERVDVNRLKEMSLIPYDTAYIKVLARGIIDKPLRVYANDFSLSAVKMIALTGGEAVKVVTLRRKEHKGEQKNSEST